MYDTHCIYKICAVLAEYIAQTFLSCETTGYKVAIVAMMMVINEK